MQTCSKYLFSAKEKIICIFLAGVMTGIIAWLFYRSIYAMVLFPGCVRIIQKEWRQYFGKRQQQEMLWQFQGMLQIVSGLLKAGYSMENAFREGEQDFARLYGKEAVMYQEFTAINHQIKMNIPVEQLLENLAEKSGIEDIDSFSQVFGFAKRGGGDMIKIFQESAEKITERAEVQREIQMVIAAKKLEQKIMALIPCGILIYIGVGMPEFLEPLYGNATGILVMSLCLTVYGISWKTAQKIVDIQM